MNIKLPGIQHNVSNFGVLQERVEKYMDAACGVIPVPELADQCKDYVKNDIPELFQLIRSQLVSPDVVDMVQASCCISVISQGQGNCPRRQPRMITIVQGL